MVKVCSQCPSCAVVKGFCMPCYRLDYKSRQPECLVDGCERKVMCKTLCATHYRRLREHGDVDATNRLSGKTALEKLYSGANVRGADECWEWRRMTDRKGYGRIRWGGRQRPAHRLMYEITFGEAPPALQVRHKCDNPPCINPSHLLTGTNQDNVDDKVERQRQNKGEQIPSAKLKAEDVPVIFQLYAQGVSGQEIGKRMGVGGGAIMRVLQRKTWKHVSIDPKIYEQVINHG